MVGSLHIIFSPDVFSLITNPPEFPFLIKKISFGLSLFIPTIEEDPVIESIVLFNASLRFNFF